MAGSVRALQVFVEALKLKPVPKIQERLQLPSIQDVNNFILINRERTISYVALYLAWMAVAFLLTSGFHGHETWLSSWFRWDSHWYQKIWQEGYDRQDPRALVFPPGYSMIIGILNTAFPIGFQLVSLIVNLLCFFVGSCIAAEFLSRRFDVPPLLIFIATLSAPTAYFVFTVYSDALFYLLFWMSIALVHSKSEHIAVKLSQFALLLVLPWVRLTGFALSAWVLLKRRFVLPLLISLSGWFALNYALSGDPFYFLHAQRLFLMPSGSFLDGFHSSFSRLLDVPTDDITQWNDYLQLAFLPMAYLSVLTCIGAWLCWRREWALGLAVLGVLFMSHNQAYWRSVVRYDLPLAPVLLLPFAKVLHKHVTRERLLMAGACIGAVIVFQFGLQIYFGNLFKSGAWGF